MSEQKFPTDDTYSEEGPQCPNCGLQYTADDSSFYNEMSYTEETCDECGETFDVSVSTTTSWTCERRSRPACEPVEGEG